MILKNNSKCSQKIIDQLRTDLDYSAYSENIKALAGEPILEVTGSDEEISEMKLTYGDIELTFKKEKFESVSYLYSKRCKDNNLDFSNYDGDIYNILIPTDKPNQYRIAKQSSSGMIEIPNRGQKIAIEGRILTFFSGNSSSLNRSSLVVRRLQEFGGPPVPQLYGAVNEKESTLWAIYTNYGTDNLPFLLLGSNLVESIAHSSNTIMLLLQEQLYLRNKFPNGQPLCKTGPDYKYGAVSDYIWQIESEVRCKEYEEKYKVDDEDYLEHIILRARHANLSKLSSGKSRVGGRKVSDLLTKEAFIKKIKSQADNGSVREGLLSIIDGVASVKKDLSKIEFNIENFEFEHIGVTQDGIPYAMFLSGGEWEVPIYGAIYWDGKKFRGYIPEDGNCYNTIAKSCYGNNEDTDGFDILKRLGIKHTLEREGSSILIYEEFRDYLESDLSTAECAIRNRLEYVQPTKSVKAF